MDPLEYLDLPGHWETVALIVELVLQLGALGVIPERRSPSSAQTWLLLILLVPIVGLPAYLLLGSAYLRGRRNRIQLEANQLFAEATADRPTVPGGVVVEERLRTILEMNRRLTSFPCATGTIGGMYSDSLVSLSEMAAAVRAAREYVHVEFYAQAWDDETDEFYTELFAAADRGVEVLLLVDQLGTFRYKGFRVLRRRLRGSAIKWRYTLPVNPFAGRFRRPDLRNHRKLMVVDGVVAFMGSQNLIERSYGKAANLRRGVLWTDVMVRVTGEVVRSLEGVFAVDWYTEAGEVVNAAHPERALVAPASEVHREQAQTFQVVPSGPGYPTEPNMRMFTQLVDQAVHRVCIVSPYFVPNEALQESLTSAAYRGVDVQVLVPEKADQFVVDHAQRSYFRALLEAGVTVLRYPAPKVLHSKLMVVDDQAAVLGSSNFDPRSFLLNFEVSMLLVGGEGPGMISRIIDGYRQECTVLDAREWAERSWASKYVDNVARLSSALQ